MHDEEATQRDELCEATRRGKRCRQTAVNGKRLCARHAASRRARRGHGKRPRCRLYDEALSPEERVALAIARLAEGLDDEIAVTRLMIVRAIGEEGNKKVPPEEYAPLVEALCRQLRTRRQVGGESADSMLGAVSTLLDEIVTEMGLKVG